MNNLIVVLIGSLGYFVDILDLFLFSVVRVPSLKDLGIPSSQLMESGVFLLNCQMGGLLLGSIVWGVLGDRRGRVKVLYLSILLYSVSTFANAFVHSVSLYGIFRALAGFGLAGELGAAITLVSESFSSEKRGVGTTIVAGVGLCGGIAAALMADFLNWRTCYQIGGIAGLLLFLIRAKLVEPEFFTRIETHPSRGKLWMLFYPVNRLLKYFFLILIGLPIWFVAGILMVFAPELSSALGVEGAPVAASNCVLYSYIGVALGDFLSGWLSQKLRSRRLAIAVFIVGIVLSVAWYLNASHVSKAQFYGICFVAGVATGYWAVIITFASEQFGTNLRATVTTTVPNFIRASVIPMTLIFRSLSQDFGLIRAANFVGVICLLLAATGLWFESETFGKDLDYIEI